MSWLALSLSPLLYSSLQSVAQISIERILNALPEGVLVAVFAWVLLRVLRKQNSGTRFAVWFLALLTVAALPVWGGFGDGRALMGPGMSWGRLHPAITIPGTWALFVFVAWALGASVAMARLAVGLWHLRRLRQSCTPVVAAELDPVVRKTVEGIGLVASTPVSISTSECVRVPAAIGFWKRTIVLPAWALRELPAEDLNVILLHEFAHLRRGDDWTNLIQKVVHAVFFFHPAVWWIERRLSVEREMACDDAVLAETANPRGYAACLVSLLEKSLAHRLAGKQWAMAQAAVRRAHEASLRLARILDCNRPMATRVWKPALGMVGAFGMVCLVALPLAPQFVAFDRAGTDAFVSSAKAPGRAQLDSSQLQSSLSPAAVIPAALRTDESSVRVASKTAKAKVIPAHAQAGAQLPSAGVVAALMNEAWPRERVIPISARADQEIVPQFPAPEFRTVVFFETTQYVASDSVVWRVQVWHVMLLTAERERLAKVPVVNSL